MKFHVTGANKDTGDDVEIDLLATDSKSAEQVAMTRGVMVSSIKEVAEPRNLDPIDLEPENSSGTAVVAAIAPPAAAPASNGSSAPAEARPRAMTVGASGDPHAAAHTPVHSHGDPHHAHQGGAHHGHDGAHHDAHHHDGHHEPHPSTHMEYKLMQNQALFLLEKSVNKMILEGWEPQGGLTIASQNNAPNYFQALVRHPHPAESAPPA